MKLTQENKAAIVGECESHLTVPSRYQPTRFDFWFPLTIGSVECAWHDEFSNLARGQKDQGFLPYALEVVLFTPQNGWIVARAVDASQWTVEDVQGTIGRLVSTVNTSMLEATAAPTASAAESASLIKHVAGLVRKLTLRPARPVTLTLLKNDRADSAPDALAGTVAEILAARVSRGYTQDSTAERVGAAAETVA